MYPVSKTSQKILTQCGIFSDSLPSPYTHDVIFEYTFRPEIMELLDILVMNILLGNCQKLKKTKILVNINKTIIYNNYKQKLIYCMHNKNSSL